MDDAKRSLLMNVANQYFPLAQSEKTELVRRIKQAESKVAQMKMEKELDEMKSRRQFLIAITGTFIGLKDVLSKAKGDTFVLSSPDADPYALYIRTSSDFQSVNQSKALCQRNFPGWLFMPWTYQWTIGYNAASGKWSKAHGYNGAFLDGNGGSPDNPPGKLAWINAFALRFYLDHTAFKGYLHLWDGGKQKPYLADLHGSGVRIKPVNAALGEKLRGFIKLNINQVISSPYRAAYALDDEISWGTFVHPTMWRVTDDSAAYPAWLKEIYGDANAPRRDNWITYEDIRPHLAEWSVKEFDASQLMDQWSFNDSYWCNFIGSLVEYANSLDPRTPCGFVGGQAPDAFGGYDYAKVMRKVQYIEAYNIGSSQAIIRSFNPDNSIPSVTSLFHQSVEDDIWQVWYYLAHGNRGHIGWVEGWFDGDKPAPWQDLLAPHLLEAGNKIGPLMLGSMWMHDGVAIYYSHPSIQLGWILDAEAHGKTWVNRETDSRLGASFLVRHAWENMLRDSGIQYNFLNYVDLIQKGISDKYHTLILPACLCLSDAEARVIEAFCRRGGTVIADYLPGVWDQHGRGRGNGGALDSLFGVKHDPNMREGDVFGTRLWCEVDQDANYDWKTYRGMLTNANTCIMDSSGFYKAVRNMPADNMNKVGSGVAVLMNLSPQWYNAYRTEGMAAARKRSVFMRHLSPLCKPKVWIENAGEDVFGYEITRFRMPNGRTLLYVCLNPETTGGELGGGNSVGLKTGEVNITLRFASPIRDVRDERRGVALKSGERVSLTWARSEAVVLSFG
jgi:hypothetical protein